MIPQSDEPGVTQTLGGRGTANEWLDPKECLAEIDRLVSSSVFLGSDALCRLLRYITHHTLRMPAEHLKEYQIATEVLDRPADFDPQADSCVRVQMGRLRSKLDQYYDSAGAHDSIVVSVPKGRYVVTFHRRRPGTVLVREPELESIAGATQEPVSDPPTAGLTESRSSSQATRSGRRMFIFLAALTGAVIVLGAPAIYLKMRTVTPNTQSNATHSPAALGTFWSPFLSGQQEPFVVFSNADFVGTALNGMRYFDPSRDLPEQLQQHYTGIGEVMGVLALDRVFLRQFGRSFRTKRSGLFTLDDARENNLIFVGSPTENLTLAKIPNTHEFVFQKLATGPNRGEQVVIDMHPQPGSANVYLPTPRGKPMTIDYAVIALMRGLDPAHWTLILAGASTVGTEAAVEYVCDDKALQDLERKLNIRNGDSIVPFEALVQVKIANDVPLETQLVATRATN